MKTHSGGIEELSLPSGRLTGTIRDGTRGTFDGVGPSSLPEQQHS